jgi:superfamily II DNA or RNA helicase
MPDRPYQAEMHVAMQTNYDAGVRQQAIVSATGTGKTYVFSSIPEKMKAKLPGRMLVLAHRDELLEQAIESINAANPNLIISKEKGTEYASEHSDVVVASVSTLGRKGSDRIARFPWEKFDKVITDEAHHATAESYSRIYDWADVLRLDTHKLHIGFTATPQRADGQALAKIFRKIVYEYSLRRAVEEGYLVEPTGIRVSTETDLSQVSVSGGDFALGALSDAINTPQRNQLVVKAWMDHGEGRRTIGFSADIQHAHDLCQMFRHYGIGCEYIWSEDPERKEKLERHQSGEYPVILNCGILTEGYDDPPVSCVLLARPTRSTVLYSQMVGRGTRLFVDKFNLIVIDVVDASRGNSLLTLPTLMGLPAALNLHGKGVVWAVKQIEEAAKDYPDIDFSTLPDINSIGQFVDRVNLFDTVLPKEVESNSILSWMPAPTGGYTLLLPNNERLSIEQNMLDKWTFKGILKGQKYRAERDTVSEIFGVADGLIQDKARENLKILTQTEPWHSNPASKSQIWLIKKLAKEQKRQIGTLPSDLDSGRASKIISRLKAREGK